MYTTHKLLSYYTCNKRHINRAYLYTNCQNSPCGKEFNTTAFANLHIIFYNVYVKHYTVKKFKYLVIPSRHEVHLKS